MTAHSTGRHTNQARDRARGLERARRRIVHGVLLVALAADVFGLLPRLGGGARGAPGSRPARPGPFLARRASRGAGWRAVPPGAPGAVGGGGAEGRDTSGLGV